MTTALRLFCIPLLTFGLLHGGPAFAADLPTYKLVPQEVTVFLRGAELFSTTSISLPAGESEVLFTNVAGNINEQSLSISADNGVLVQSYNISNDFLTDETQTLSPQANALKQKIEEVQGEKEKQQIQLSVIKEQLAVLAENRKLGSEKAGASTTEVSKMLELVDKKMSAALNLQAKTNVQLKKIDEKLAKLELQLEEEKGKSYQPGGQILVSFYAPKATTSRIALSYVSPGAGWMPSYDVRVAKPGAPANLVYKAKVFQNTGINWNNVRLDISTGNPSQGAQAPSLNPWYVNSYSPVAYRATGNRAAMEVNVTAPAPAMAKSAPAKQVVQQQTLDGYVNTDSNGINTVFNIAIPYTIPSDGKGHIVMIKSASLPGSYYYMATPKLDPDAFLTIELSNKEELNLLPGQTNIFFEDSFVGQGKIGGYDGKDEIKLSLG
ncbi:MAG: mucoidy inhibitor MuiA family protein, partial [Azovibrio sp.]